MSVFNAITTAVSGINAQSTAFSNLSNNIANSQTVGYKAASTAFQDFVSGEIINSSRNEGNSDSVAAVTIQHVDKQGTSTVSNDSLAMAVSGNGLFNVTKAPADEGTSVNQNQTRYYTRNGEFYEDKKGYLVNTSGYYLNGYNVDRVSGELSSQLAAVNIADIQYRPIDNPTITVKGYVGFSGSKTTDSSKNVTTQSATGSETQTIIYDAKNDSHKVNLKWTPATDDDLKTYHVTQTGNTTSMVLTVNSADSNTSIQPTPTDSKAKAPAVSTLDDSNKKSPQQYLVKFDSSTGAIQSAYAIDSKSKTLGTVNLIDGSGTSNKIKMTLYYQDLNDATPPKEDTEEAKKQAFSLDLGSVGSTAGAILSASASPVTTTPTTDSKSSSQVGSYSGAEIESDGSIMAKFSLGDTQLIGKVALTTFAVVNNLQEVSGQAYLATPSAGVAQTGLVGENGTGNLTVGYTESSTTDLTSDLSSLIIAQQAYTANTKIVTTANELLQATIAMKQ